MISKYDLKHFKVAEIAFYIEILCKFWNSFNDYYKIQPYTKVHNVIFLSQENTTFEFCFKVMAFQNC